MVLQTIIYPNECCLQKEIYYQSKVDIVQKEGIVYVPENTEISFLSYMNMFDVDLWKQYTSISKIVFKSEVCGRGKFVIRSINEHEKISIAEKKFDNPNESFICEELEIELAEIGGKIYFELVSYSNVGIKQASFETLSGQKQNRDIDIALNICTYQRKHYIDNTIRKLKTSRFFDNKEELYGKLSVYIVDNGSELDDVSEKRIKVFHNKNTGGAGGFKRGLEEIRKTKYSHVIFADDDIEFLSESFYRVYAFLAHLKEEYTDYPIAGRMFRLDERWRQYTATEIWNRGEIIHIGFNSDMRNKEQVIRSNLGTNGQYGGWWFCCYPMSFVTVNDPLPVFIHCDDVEYGLRNGNVPIIINGVQVWHETYEYRKSQMVEYYDVRNSMIVNAMYTEVDAKDVLFDWKKRITDKHIVEDYVGEYLLIKALHNFIRGPRWLKKNGNKQVKIPSQRSSLYIKYVNKIYWRYCQWALLNRYILIKNKYREEMKK